MRMTQPLDDLFATGSHVRVLRALHQLPRGLTVSGREIARRAGVSHPRAREVLADLDDQGLLIVGRSPSGSFYRLNPDHVLVDPVEELFRREGAVARELEDAIAAAVSRLGEVRAAYLFGSSTRGDMRPDSDLDVAVISSGDLPEDRPGLDEVHHRFGNRVNVIRLTGRGGAKLRKRVAAEGRPLRVGPRRKSGV